MAGGSWILTFLPEGGQGVQGRGRTLDEAMTTLAHKLAEEQRSQMNVMAELQAAGQDAALRRMFERAET